MIFVVGRRDAAQAAKTLKGVREKFFEIGEVVETRRNASRMIYE